MKSFKFQSRRCGTSFKLKRGKLSHNLPLLGGGRFSCIAISEFPNFRISEFVLIAVCILSFSAANAQLSSLSTSPEKKDTRAGNKEFNKDDYTDAEASYKKALDKKNNMPEATFNLGDAVYEQKRYDEAIKQFQLSAQTNPDSKVKAKAFHNLGNSYLEQKKWDEAVKSYKEALRLNCKDNDTKYNLAYANSMIQKEKNNQQNNKNQDKKDKNKDKKDQQNQDKQKQDQKRPDQKQDNQQGQNDQQKKSGEQPKLSKEDAEKLLQAAQNEEQKTNQKVQQKEIKPVNVKILKDW